MAKHNPDEVAIVMDISGFCEKCRHRGQARLTAYYSGEILVRCNNCKTANRFNPDDASYLDPNKYKPFRSDDTDSDDRGSGRYTKGKR